MPGPEMTNRPIPTRVGVARDRSLSGSILLVVILLQAFTRCQRLRACRSLQASSRI